jgi:hypothetical protein
MDKKDTVINFLFSDYSSETISRLREIRDEYRKLRQSWSIISNETSDCVDVAAIVYPGYHMPNKSMQPLRQCLENKGVEVLENGLENEVLDFNAVTLGRIKESFNRIAASHKRKKLALIGWSAGGVVASELVHMNNAPVDYVISLGAPVNWRNTDNGYIRSAANHFSQDPCLSDVYQNKKSIKTLTAFFSLYSSGDGIVEKSDCLFDEKNVYGANIHFNNLSHWRLGCNPDVIQTVLNILSGKQKVNSLSF